MIKNNRYFPFVILLISLFGSSAAYAVLNIEITQGIEGAVPIAVVPFGWQVTSQQAKHPKRSPVDVGAVISADLARTGRFDSLAIKDMLAKPDADSAIDQK